MVQAILHAISGLPKEAVVAVLAATPVAELRAAIPVGMLVYKMPATEVFVLAQLGNILPAFLVYGLCEWWVRLMERRRGWLHRITDHVLTRTRDKMHGQFIKWGVLAVVIFVGIPFPGTGAWTGSLGAYLLRIPFKQAVFAVLLGNLIAGGVVTAMILSGSAAFSALR